MSAVPDPDRSRQRQLGELMTELGMITPEQLAVVLEAQRESGQPLGQIIVELGFASGAAVAHALALQSGGALKTEHGYALGVPARAEARAERHERPGDRADGAQPVELPKLRLAPSARPVGARTESETPRRTIEDESEPPRPQWHALNPDELLDDAAEAAGAAREIRSSPEAERERGMAEVERLKTAVADLRESLREALERLAASQEVVAERDRAVAEVERLQGLLEEGRSAAAAEVAAVLEERDRLAAGLGESEAGLREALERLAASQEVVAERDRAVAEVERLGAELAEAREQAGAVAAVAVERDRLAAGLDEVNGALAEAQERLVRAGDGLAERGVEVERLQGLLEEGRSAAAAEVAAVLEERDRLAAGLGESEAGLREALERLAASQEVVAERDRAVAEVERLGAELAEAREQAGAVAAVAVERDRLAAGLDEVNGALAEAQERLAAAEAEGVARDGAIARVEDERDRVAAEAGQLETRLEEARSESAAKASAAEEQHGRLAARLDETQESLREARQLLEEAEMTTIELGGARAEVQRLQVLLRQAHSEHEAEVVGADQERERLVSSLKETQKAFRGALERLAASDEAFAERDRAIAEVERLEADARKLGETERALKKARRRLAAAAEERDGAMAEVERLQSVADDWQEWVAHAPVGNLAVPVPAAEPEKVREPRERGLPELSEGPSPAGPGPEEREHTLLVPSENGYALVQRNGSPPSAGETLELSVGESGELARFTVARVGRSLLPDKRICVYLLSD